MAYNEFAYFYDEFNGEADYDALYEHIQKELAAHGIADGIVADLGCGGTDPDADPSGLRYDRHRPI